MRRIIDNIILNIFGFVLIKNVFYYILDDKVLSVLISVFILLLFKFSTKIRCNKPKRNIDKFDYYLKTAKKEDKLLLIYSLIPSEKKPIIKNDHITYYDTLIYEHYLFEKMSKDCFVEMIQKCPYSKLIIFGTVDNVDFANDKIIRIVSIEEFYDMLAAKGKIPVYNQKIAKHRIKDMFINALNRKNSKYFFISGITMALLIPVTPLKIYYICISTLSLILSIISLSKRSKTPKKSLFD